MAKFTAMAKSVDPRPVLALPCRSVRRLHEPARRSVGRRSTLAFLWAVALWGCSGPPGRELGELLVRDSLYLDPETLTPYSGPVFRAFPAEEGGGVQLRATLRDGAWEGEMTLYHPTGRVREQGETASGAKCGGWIENERPEAPASVYAEIKEDLESLVVYAPCPER